MKNLKSLSKFISFILRHHPEKVRIKLDKNGWANTDELIEGINNNSRFRIDLKTLEEIVRTDEKGRYSFSEDKTKIRANQGHSIKVDLELKELKPPKVLFHGTGERSISRILSEGLKPMGRQYVHLSKDIPTATKVGKRHGKPRILLIDTQGMVRDGYKFYLSENKIWLTNKIPPEYLKLLGDEI